MQTAEHHYFILRTDLSGAIRCIWIPWADLFETLTLLPCIWEALLRIWTETPTVLSGVLCGFPQLIEENACIVSQIFLNIFCWPCISIYLFLNINQLDALNFIIRLFQASTCFEHMCSKHVEAWNKRIIKFGASSWLILRNKYLRIVHDHFLSNSLFINNPATPNYVVRWQYCAMNNKLIEIVHFFWARFEWMAVLIGWVRRSY